MYLWIILGVVAFVSFSLGIIAGCLIMSKEDKFPDKSSPAHHEIPSNNNVTSSENVGQAMGK